MVSFLALLSKDSIMLVILLFTDWSFALAPDRRSCGRIVLPRNVKLSEKLDGVGPVDNSPPTDKLHHFFLKKKKLHVTRDMWHVTRDTWHVTRDTWHVTCDTFGGVKILSKFQLPSSYRLWFMILWRSGGKGSLTDWINQWINDEAVYRTAPATPGLLIIYYSCILIIY